MDETYCRVTERTILVAVITFHHGVEWIRLGIVMMFHHMDIYMFLVGGMNARHNDDSLLLAVVMIRHVMGMIIPGVTMILRAVGIALPDRVMIRRAGKVMNLVGGMFHHGMERIPQETG